MASLNVSAYEAAELASSLRSALVAQRQSFIFETVLSDPVGEKVEQLSTYAALGYVLEQLLPPLVVFTTPEHEELKSIATGYGTWYSSFELNA